MKQMLVEYARYNLWANSRLISLFRTIDNTLISQPIVNSFPSIRETLLHIWDAESLWIERLNGHSPTSFPSKHFEGSNSDVLDIVLKTSEAFLQVVIEQAAPNLRDKRTFTTLTGNQNHIQCIRDMIHHCMNHSTFHRGQLVMMCRQLNIAPIPSTDFIVYMREMQG
ncbi:MAG: DinB family protein [Saprospiraceae bacterium]|nr:DinB family protein [Saprospiraceae bacterium]